MQGIGEIKKSGKAEEKSSLRKRAKKEPSENQDGYLKSVGLVVNFVCRVVELNCGVADWNCGTTDVENYLNF
jgi:hypothetical protein